MSIFKEKILVHIYFLKKYLEENFINQLPLLIPITFLIFKLMIINTPNSFIFDEAHYIPAVRKMISGEAANNEHPPLAKALMMLGIEFFGDNPFGWRIFIVILSVFSIYLIYKIALELTNDRIASISASYLFATDIMAFNIGSMAILDAPTLTFSLLGTLLFLRRKYYLSAIFFGLSFLCKITSIFIIASILLFLLFKIFYDKRKFLETFNEWFKVFEKIFFIALIVSIIGLSIYDIPYKAFSTPFEHIDFMINYHTSLTFNSTQSAEVVFPHQWITVFPPAPYYVVTVQEKVGEQVIREYHTIAYYGVYSPTWWTIWIIFPVTIYEMICFFKRKNEREIDIPLLAFSWILLNFFPYVFFAYFLHRWVYSFYFYMVVPALCIATPYYLIKGDKSKTSLLMLITMQSFWFFYWFPVKSKLQIDLLSMLGLSV